MVAERHWRLNSHCVVSCPLPPYFLLSLLFSSPFLLLWTTVYHPCPYSLYQASTRIHHLPLDITVCRYITRRSPPSPPPISSHLLFFPPVYVVSIITFIWHYNNLFFVFTSPSQHTITLPPQSSPSQCSSRRVGLPRSRNWPRHLLPLLRKISTRSGN